MLDRCIAKKFAHASRHVVVTVVHGILLGSLSHLTSCRVAHPSHLQIMCVGEGLVSRPDLLGESAQGIYYLTSGKMKGRRKCWKILMNERRKVKMMKRSRKSERTLNSCMHGDDNVRCARVECDNTELTTKTATLRVRSRVHVVLRVDSLDLGFHVVIRVGRPNVQ